MLSTLTTLPKLCHFHSKFTSLLYFDCNYACQVLISTPALVLGDSSRSDVLFGTTCYFFYPYPLSISCPVFLTLCPYLHRYIVDLCVNYMYFMPNNVYKSRGTLRFPHKILCTLNRKVHVLGNASSQNIMSKVPHYYNVSEREFWDFSSHHLTANYCYVMTADKSNSH